jgi:hypothetical protein
MGRWSKVLLGLVMTLLYLAVSTLDYHDAVADERVYIRMVCTQAWPNFKNLELNCEGETMEPKMIEVNSEDYEKILRRMYDAEQRVEDLTKYIENICGVSNEWRVRQMCLDAIGRYKRG